MTSLPTQTTDVTVVGAGPVGLFLAAELALAGATVQVLERSTEPAAAMKAQSINVLTAEALDRRGLLGAAEEVQREVLTRVGSYGGAPDTRFTGHFAGVVLDAALVDWSDPDLADHTAADGARMVPQPELEAILAAHAERLGVRVDRGVEVTSLEDTGDGVVIGTTSGTLHSGWLVGCDGGHSTVRRFAGIDFVGDDPEFTGYQAVVDIADPDKLAMGWNWSTKGAYRYGPQQDRVATVEFGETPVDRSAPITLAAVQESLRRVSGTDVTLTALRATPTRWTDNTRQAATYRLGRVLLAGDAAHVHPPFGGQGLNLGAGDAVNLGWKLGAVITGHAPPGLLDTYDAERRPVGAWALEWTRAQTCMMRGDPKSAALRAIVADLLNTPDGATHAVKKISGVAQRLDLPGAHPMVGRYVPDLWLDDGSRLADHAHGGGFVLLDRTPTRELAGVAAAWPGRVTSVFDHPAIPAGVLVRPDGVVAWATDDPNDDGLADVLTRWLGCATA